MMRVALDARQMFRANRRGTGKNLLDLYTQLARMRPNWSFFLFHQVNLNEPPLTRMANVQRRQIDIRGGDRLNLWEQVRLPVAARWKQATVLHCPFNTGPRFPLRPMVVTIHDLIPLECAPDKPATHAWRRRVTAAAHAARHIVTPSNYSKAQLIERLGLPEHKITVNYWAADTGVRRVMDASERERIGASFGLRENERYVLAFGGDDPRKNTRRILDAWAGLPRPLSQEYTLLIVGLQPSVLGMFRDLAGEIMPGRRALLHGFVPEQDLPAILSGAVALCYPSLSEGFGLPVLDAFASDVPVLTSNTTSLPEIAGDAAFLVDPSSAESIRDGLVRLLEDDTRRRLLIARGRARLQDFSWERCAACLASVIEAAAG